MASMQCSVRRWRRQGVVVAVALGGALALGACGGGSSSTSSKASTNGSNTNQATAAYRQCLRDHGLSFGRRGSGTSATTDAGGSGVPDTGTPPSSRAPLTPQQQAQRQAAQQACQSKLPSGFLQQRQQDLAAYRSCLKDHGVTLPATQSTDPFAGNGLRGINRNDPTVQAALKACAPLAPSGGRFGPGGTGGTGGTGSSSSVPAALGAPVASAA